MKKGRIFWVLCVASIAGLAMLWVFTPDGSAFKRAAAWQALTLPGELSAAHARLEKNCAVCHARFGGIDDADCISCHALDARLLNWPENIFHADLGHCIGCHPEHLGRNLPPTRMNHLLLARINLEQLRASTVSTTAGLGDQLWMWLKHQTNSTDSLPDYPQAQAAEVLLNCYVCHAGSDIHKELFGRDCLICHETSAWTIPAYRHPLGRSIDCMECHKAPKSHFKGHFKKMPGRVGDCYMCHATPSWQDIGHPPWYKKWLKQLKVEEVEEVEDLFDSPRVTDSNSR